MTTSCNTAQSIVWRGQCQLSLPILGESGQLLANHAHPNLQESTLYLSCTYQIEPGQGMMRKLAAGVLKCEKGRATPTAHYPDLICAFTGTIMKVKINPLKHCVNLQSMNVLGDSIESEGAFGGR